MEYSTDEEEGRTNEGRTNEGRWMHVSLSKSSWRLVLLLSAVVSHTGFGIFPGLLRYLQTDANIDPLLVMGFMLGVPAICLTPLMLYWFGLRVMFSVHRLWLCVLISTALTLLFVYSSRFTLSVYVQLVLLAVPFMVTFLAKFLLRRPIPPYTIPAMIMSFIGAMVALFGDLINSEFRLSTDDLIGIGLSVLCAISAASWIVFVGSVEHTYPISLLTYWNLIVGLLAVPVSAGIEDWSILYNLSVRDWFMFITVSFGVLTLIQFLFLWTIRHLGPTLVGALLPWRLVVAIVFGASPLLSEQITLLNLIGSAVVIVVLFAYLSANHKRSELQKKMSEEPLVNTVEGEENPSRFI